MSKRISKDTREAAAVLCSQMATWWTSDPARDGVPRTAPTRSTVTIPTDVDYLSDAARDHVASNTGDARDTADDDWYATQWAEAEALLRTGWTP